MASTEARTSDTVTFLCSSSDPNSGGIRFLGLVAFLCDLELVLFFNMANSTLLQESSLRILPETELMLYDNAIPSQYDFEKQH